MVNSIKIAYVTFNKCFCDDTHGRPKFIKAHFIFVKMRVIMVFVQGQIVEKQSVFSLQCWWKKNPKTVEETNPSLLQCEMSG